MRSRQMVLAAVAGLIAIGVVGVLVTRLNAPPRFTNAGDGLALGPSIQHARASTDVIAQIATGALSTAAGNAGPGPTLGENAPTPQEKALLDLTNSDRSQNGLGPLTYDPISLQVARVRAAAQIPDGPLSHYNSLGDLAFVGMLADAGVAYTLAGENLARATAQDTSTVTRLNEALMNSPLHRANILEPTFNRLAIGAATGPDGRIAFAEIFRASDH
jgi:uncharacterized protein YkwD